MAYRLQCMDPGFERGLLQFPDIKSQLVELSDKLIITTDVNMAVQLCKNLAAGDFNIMFHENVLIFGGTFYRSKVSYSLTKIKE